MQQSNSKNWIVILRQIALAALCFAVATGLVLLVNYIHLPDTSIIAIYLLAVFVIVWRTDSLTLGFLSSLGATFIYHYYFAEPQHSFAVDQPAYIIPFISMIAVALGTGSIINREKRDARTARRQEEEIRAIYQLTNHLTDARSLEDISEISAKAIGEALDCDVGFLRFDENGEPEDSYVYYKIKPEPNLIHRKVEDREALRYRLESLRTGVDIGEEFYDWPVYGREKILGLIRIPKQKAEQFNAQQAQSLRSMIESTSLAMDRYWSAEERIHSREEIVRERYRTNLLRSISHDIRTPLSGILGSAEILTSMTSPEDHRTEIIGGIRKDAEWLYFMVENILNLTRIQDGKLILKKEPEAVEEVIGAACEHIAKRYPNYEVHVQIPEELLMVPMDVRLIEQVLINLLDNAVKHTRPEESIEILVEKNTEAGQAEFLVRDGGTGIPEEDLPMLFQEFYTENNMKDAKTNGIGLGLAICKTVVNAHGGTISAENRKDAKGAAFRFTLPLEDDTDEI